MKTNFKIFSELLPNSLPKSLLGAALVIMPFSVPAEEVRVSDGIVPGDSNSKWVVGGSVGSIENPFVGEDSHDGYLAPNIEYRGEKLFVKGGELGYNLFRSNGFGVGVVLTGKPSYFADDENYDDNEKLEHIEERDGTLDAGWNGRRGGEVAACLTSADHRGLTSLGSADFVDNPLCKFGKFLSISDHFQRLNQS